MSHNVEDVIGDIEDVKNDLNVNVFEQMRKEMQALLETAIAHVEEDADWTGNLVRSLQKDGVKTDIPTWEVYEFTIGTDANIAPYAPLVEFGTGARTDKPGPGSMRPRRPDQYPAGYPYESPDVDPEKLVGMVYEWIETKPVQGQKATQWETAMAIAKTIVSVGTYAHPFLRPAWFKHRLQLKRTAREAVKDAFR